MGGSDGPGATSAAASFGNGAATSVQIEEAYARIQTNDIKYRFVLDMATLKP